jgi:hypothetical protein
MPPVARIPPALAIAPFNGQEAVRAGLLTERQLRGSAWVRLFPNIYVSAEAPLDHRVWCEAAILRLPHGTAVAGSSAAHLWGLKGIGPPDRVSVLVPPDCRVRPDPRLRIRRSGSSSMDVTEIFGIPLTTPERTAFDLARLLPRTDAVVFLDALLKQHKVSLDRLTAYLAAHSGWPGLPAAYTALSLTEPLAESPMETRLRLLALDAGLPKPIAQYKIMRGRRFVARVDYAYPDYKIALEYDGDHHRDKATFRFDMERQNELHVMGWTVLRFNADDVLQRPEHTATLIRTVLTKAGWVAS